jgi:hypothetical protein
MLAIDEGVLFCIVFKLIIDIKKIPWLISSCSIVVIVIQIIQVSKLKLGFLLRRSSWAPLFARGSRTTNQTGASPSLLVLLSLAFSLDALALAFLSLLLLALFLGNTVLFFFLLPLLFLATLALFFLSWIVALGVNALLPEELVSSEGASAKLEVVWPR